MQPGRGADAGEGHQVGERDHDSADGNVKPSHAARDARAQHADGDAQLTARRSGQELAEGDGVAILAVRPATADAHVLPPKLAEVRDRTAERDRPEAAGHEEHLQR